MITERFDCKPPDCWPMVGTVPLVIRDRPVMKPWYTQVPAAGWYQYSLFDVDGEMVYIGMTSGLQARLRQHARRFPRVVLALVLPCESELVALRAEATLIAIFDPPANISRGRVDLLPPEQWAAIARMRQEFEIDA